jgi:hypothetical protein
MAKQSIVTRESLNEMLHRADQQYVGQVVGRALVALFRRQTAEEQNVASTIEHNNVGFTGGDSYGGTMTAKYFLKHNRLEQWMVERWMAVGKSGFPRLCKYAKQLNEIAQSKQGVTQ